MKKQLLHLSAGNESWNPTDKELQALAAKFRRALLKSNGKNIPVVPTRDHVYPTIVEIDTDEDFEIANELIDLMSQALQHLSPAKGSPSEYCAGFSDARQEIRKAFSDAILSLGMEHKEQNNG